VEPRHPARQPGRQPRARTEYSTTNSQLKPTTQDHERFRLAPTHLDDDITLAIAARLLPASKQRSVAREDRQETRPAANCGPQSIRFATSERASNRRRGVYFQNDALEALRLKLSGK